MGSAPWRAGRASASLLAWLEDAAPADTVLAALEPLGIPTQGWWEVLAHVRHGGVALRLPRAGDPRGLALPRHADAQAALGLERIRGGSVWLIPRDSGTWEAVEMPDHPVRHLDPGEAYRALRSEVVRAAHILDRGGATSSTAPDRSGAERTVDSWLLESLPLPTQRRTMAALGLRILLATQHMDHPHDVDVRALATAARAVVEVAYSADGDSR